MSRRGRQDGIGIRFGNGERRQDLLAQLDVFIQRARDCGFVSIAIGGSFATAKPEPKDLDLLFVYPPGMNREDLSAECAELVMNDAAFKRRFGHNALNCKDDPEMWML